MKPWITLSTVSLAALLFTKGLSADMHTQYLSGFGNEFASEALPGALPEGRNTPQNCPYGLYAEQLSGTSFTTPREHNLRTWFYRIRPSVTHGSYSKVHQERLQSDFTQAHALPDPFLWHPLETPETATDFIEGWTTLAGSGSPDLKAGMAIHLYSANSSMGQRCFCNADGDLLIVPQEGHLEIQTECGFLDIQPGEIAVIPRGFKFHVSSQDSVLKGYIAEVFAGHFQLPQLGPIGANGLANPRDFLTPVAAYEDLDVPYTVITKFSGELFACEMDHSPFDVVAYHGNYVPYKYDLDRFCPMNAVAYDHPDPSIFTVLTCPTTEPGVAALDFVIFPPRWTCAEDTFRPPYYHRNCMSEYMGLIKGCYEAKTSCLLPGGGTLHSCMTPHGPETETFSQASSAELQPQRLGDGALAFMFESTYIFRLTDAAIAEGTYDVSYTDCWKDLGKHFEEPKTSEQE